MNPELFMSLKVTADRKGKALSSYMFKEIMTSYPRKNRSSNRLKRGRIMSKILA